MLSIIDQIKLELHKIIPSSSWSNWLDSPNKELGMKSPVELLSTKNYAPLWQFISQHKEIIP